MRDLPREPYLLEETLARVDAGLRTNHLERDGGVEHEIVSAPHVAHAALADARNHPVAAGDDGAGREPGSAGIGSASLVLSSS